MSTILLLVVLLVFLFYDDSANCFDGIVNGDESGIDCGGSCVRICPASVTAPSVVWSDSFKIADGQYNAVAYVENINAIAATKSLEYTFTLYSQGQLVAERRGVAVLPPDSVYPIFEGRIITDGKEVTETRFTIEPVAVWQPATMGIEQFRVFDIRLRGADTLPRLTARIENTAIQSAQNVEIVTTLFNEDNEPLTASQTFIEELQGRNNQEVVFTWPESIAKTVRSCSVPSDVLLGIDLSGSMNNDGANPPEPITSALTAASGFVTRLSEDDQIGVVTFATEAETAVPLTSDKSAANRLISSLGISPAAETGFTNTVEALEEMKAELNSDRHSGDARRAAVLLTDGLPTGRVESEVLIAEALSVAKDMQENGVTLYVIGLGENVDRTFVYGLVENPEQAYFAANGSQLDQIYQTITGDLCESGTTKIDIIPKTTTNFVPLR